MRVILLCTALAAISAAQVAPGAKPSSKCKTASWKLTRGSQSFRDLDALFAARKSAMDKRQANLAGLQEQLQKGAAAMSEEAQRKLACDIDHKSKALNYDLDMARADYEQAQSDLMRELGRKFHDVVGKYAHEKNIAIVVDVGNPQSRAFWWADAADITGDVVWAYDAAYAAPARPDK